MQVSGVNNTTGVALAEVYEVPPVQISLLPASAAMSLSSVSTSSGTLGKLDATTNLWGLESGSGQVTMTNSADNILTTVNMGNIQLSPMYPGNPVVGYPEVRYGWSPYAAASTPGSPIFPEQGQIADVKNMDLWLTAAYMVNVAPANPIDIAYDLWITSDQYASYVGIGVTPSTNLELMVWLYHTGMMPAQSVSTVPIIAIPVTINGVLNSSCQCQVYLYSKGNGGNIVSVVIPAPDPTSLTTIGVNLSAVLTQVEPYLEKYLGMPTSTFENDYLEGIELGSEFEASNGNASYQWTLASLDLTVPGP
jgi:hypothetical protein